jgi:ABC-type transport system substrate-binding protein
MLDYSVQNSVTVLQKSPYWFGIGAIDGTPQTLDIDTFIMRVIPDETSALAEFKAGKLSIMSLASFPAERKHMQQDARFLVQTRLTGYFTFLFYNLRRPFVGGDANSQMVDIVGKEEYTKGAAVRKALNYAIDREEMNQVLHDGEYLISDSPIYPVQAFWYYHDIVKYRFDLAASFEWLLAGGVISEIPTITTIEETIIDTVTTDETVVITETETPMSLLAILGALGAVVFVALYRKRK